MVLRLLPVTEIYPVSLVSTVCAVQESNKDQSITIDTAMKVTRLILLGLRDNAACSQQALETW